VSNMSNRKKIKIKTDQRKKRFLAGILLLISCCIVLTLIILIKPILKPVYEIESKVEDVEKSKKENTSDYKTTGWLKVQGTNIDLPVIGFEDMNQTVPVELGNYAWNLDKEEKFRNKVNIMGHNILNDDVVKLFKYCDEMYNGIDIPDFSISDLQTTLFELTETPAGINNKEVYEAVLLE